MESLKPKFQIAKSKLPSPRVWLNALMYRHLRNDMALRMAATGMSWAAINKVLRSTGQQPIVKVEHQPTGVRVYFKTNKTTADEKKTH